MGIQVRNVSQLKQKFRRLPIAVQDEVIEVIQEAGDEIKDRAQVNTRSEQVRQGIRKRKLKKGLDAKVAARHWRSAIEEFGAKAHTIDPGDKNVLAGEDFGPVTGTVRHPGTPARAYLFPAFEVVRQDFLPRLSRRVNRALRKLRR